MTPVPDRKDSMNFTSFDDYHYVIIKTNDAKQFIFTCLLAKKVGDVMKEIAGVTKKKQRRLYPSTLWYDSDNADLLSIFD